MNEYLTPSEITRYADISVGAILKAIHRQELPSSETANGSCNVTIEDAIAFCETQGLDTRLLQRLRRKRILIVDDDDVFAEMLFDVFSSEPRILSRKSPSLFEARVALREFRPHLVFLDAILPDGSGVDLLLELKEMKLYPEPVILGITALSSRKTVEGMEKNGARNVLLKPVSPEHLLQTAKSILF